MRALGREVAGVIGNDAGLVDQVRAAGAAHRRAGLAAAARAALPAPARLRRRRHQEPGRRRTRAPSPRRCSSSEFVGRRAVGTHRHRGHRPGATPTGRGDRRAAPGSGPACSPSSRSTSSADRARLTAMTADRRTACRSRAQRPSARRGLLDVIEKVGQQGPAPGDDVPVPDHLRDRAVARSSRSLGVSVTEEIAVPDPDRGRRRTTTRTRPSRSSSPRRDDLDQDDATSRSRSARSPIQSLLSIEGIRFIFTSFVSNFAGLRRGRRHVRRADGRGRRRGAPA